MKNKLFEISKKTQKRIEKDLSLNFDVINRDKKDCNRKRNYPNKKLM